MFNRNACILVVTIVFGCNLIRQPQHHNTTTPTNAKTNHSDTTRHDRNKLGQKKKQQTNKKKTKQKQKQNKHKKHKKHKNTKKQKTQQNFFFTAVPTVRAKISRFGEPIEGKCASSVSVRSSKR